MDDVIIMSLAPNGRNQIHYEYGRAEVRRIVFDFTVYHDGTMVPPTVTSVGFARARIEQDRLAKAGWIRHE